MKFVVQTNDAWSSFILRVMLGVVILPHGAQKLLGWFGGHGFVGTMAFFTERMHVPSALALLVILAESIGGLGLIIGFLTRLTAFGLACIMATAIWTVHWPYGFFMNWSGKKAGEGFEYPLLAIAISVALAITGPGKWSVDRAIAKRLTG